HPQRPVRAPLPQALRGQVEQVARRRQSTRPPIPPGFDPLRAIELSVGFQNQVPDITEFVLSDRYLDRPNIYTRQATLLKVATLQTELFTDYDYEVIDQWARSYEETADENGQGSHGIQPDVLERIALCQAEGRPWFREIISCIGRRGSKGYIG